MSRQADPIKCRFPKAAVVSGLDNLYLIRSQKVEIIISGAFIDTLMSMLQSRKSSRHPKMVHIQLIINESRSLSQVYTLGMSN